MHNNFLKDEVRNGFYIPASVKQCWAVELDILAAIDSLCQKYGIKYYAEYGTLLGAVRHGGFIPWDDDLDIGMFRTDLDKFLSVAHELPNGYVVHNYKNCPDYTQFIYKIVSAEQINIDPSHLQNTHGMPYICGVDIFVMDNVSDNEHEEKERCTKANYIIQIADEIFSGNTNYTKSIQIIHKIEWLTGESVDSHLYSLSTKNNVDLRIRLYEIGENLFKLFNNQHTNKISQIMPWGLNGMRHYPREYYEELVRIPFENTTIPVPSRYNSMLINRYGDYMSLVKSGSAHDYPCFAKQRENFKQLIVNEMGSDIYNQFFPNYHYDSVLSFSNDTDFSQENDNGKTIVFLPFCDQYWQTMQLEYIKAIANPTNEVYVIPIPYYYKDFGTKELVDEQFDIEYYPEDIELYDWYSIDLNALQPNVIYIQNPYDEYNPVTSVHPSFYSSVLKNITSELVYIPWFTTDDFDEHEERSYLNMDAYCTMPGVVNADRIILSSNTQKDMYIQKLKEWSKYEDISIWHNKIEVVETTELAKTNTDNSSKKAIMYYIGLGQTIEAGMDMMAKIQNTLSLVENYRKSLVLYIKIDSTFEDSLNQLNPLLYDEFAKIIDPIKNDAEWIYDNSEYIIEAVNYCDAFFGDAGYVANMFREQGKPCMIQNIRLV